MIELWCIGKTKEKWVNQGIEKFEKRIKPFTKFEIVYLKDNKAHNVKDKKAYDESEIMKKLQDGDYLILLDEKGKSFRTLQFSEKINHLRATVHNRIVFLIGGAYGFSEQLYKRANEKISLSPMTMPHDLVRVVFLEQLYRAFTIIHNKNYHHI